jgi:hypothetical protein
VVGALTKGRAVTRNSGGGLNERVSSAVPFSPVGQALILGVTTLGGVKTGSAIRWTLGASGVAHEHAGHARGPGTGWAVQGARAHCTPTSYPAPRLARVQVEPYVGSETMEFDLTVVQGDVHSGVAAGNVVHVLAQQRDGVPGQAGHAALQSCGQFGAQSVPPALVTTPPLCLHSWYWWLCIPEATHSHVHGSNHCTLTVGRGESSGSQRGSPSPLCHRAS